VSTAPRCHCSASDRPPLIAYTDRDRLKHRLKELSPADAGIIGELIGASRRIARFNLLGLVLAGRSTTQRRSRRS